MKSSDHTPSPETEALLDAAEDLLEEIDQVLDENVVKSMAEQAAIFDPAESRPPSLSDLMREGAQLAPQAFGKWESAGGPTCSLMAAYRGAEKRGLLA